jgi:hypothetical protein
MSPLPAASVPLRGSRSVQAVRTRVNFIKGMDRIVTIAKLVAQTLAALAGVSRSDWLSSLSETRGKDVILGVADRRLDKCGPAA